MLEVNNVEEEWKDIVFIKDGIVYDYTGLYQISNLGKVRSVKTNKLKSLRPDKRGGYLTVSLWKDNKELNCKVHRLVAFAFVEGYFDGAVVNHKDENKQNNKHDNLEWCTVTYNNSYNNKQDKCKKRINMYTLDGKYVRTFDSLKEVGEYFGKSVGNLSSHLKGRQKTFANHIFKYEEEK
jgi:hypothetical protein